MQLKNTFKRYRKFLAAAALLAGLAVVTPATAWNLCLDVSACNACYPEKESCYRSADDAYTSCTRRVSELADDRCRSLIDHAPRPSYFPSDGGYAAYYACVAYQTRVLGDLPYGVGGSIGNNLGQTCTDARDTAQLKCIEQKDNCLYNCAREIPCNES